MGGFQLNPDVVAFFSGVKTAAEKATTTAAQTGSAGWLIVFAIVMTLVAFGLVIYYIKTQRVLETSGNIVRIGRDATQSQVAYALSNQKRIGLRAYLKTLAAAGVPAGQMSLTNFYVCAANAAGVFYPAANGVVSMEAGRAAVLAGARGFVFDIWPDLTPAANFAPSIQVVEAGSMWRRISLNQIPFAQVLKAIVQEAFEIAERPGNEDPLFLYLRFRGQPRTATFNATANALSAILERYRLDASFNTCRGQDRVFSMPITDLFKKVIIFSNTMASNTLLADYINVAPKAGVKVEWGTYEARTISDDMKTDTVRAVQHNLTWIAPESESAEAEANSYDYKAAMDYGVQFTALNMWTKNDKLEKYLSPELFGVQSFALKPTDLRYTIETIPAAQSPANMQWGSGTTAGTMRDPAPIRMPGLA
jgi:hypothetical protein